MQVLVMSLKLKPGDEMELNTKEIFITTQA